MGGAPAAGDREPRTSRGLVFRAVAASAGLALLVSGAFAVLLVAIDDLRESGTLARETREELRTADVLEKLVIDVETGQRGFVITREERFLEPWNAAREAFPAQAARLIELADDAAQRDRAREIATAGSAYIRNYSEPLVAAVRSGESSARSTAATAEGKRRVDALRARFDRFAEVERAKLTTRQEDADADARRAIVAAGVGLGGSLLLILLVGTYLTRSIVLPVRRTSDMAGRLAEGDLGVRLPETGVGEIGALERSFNEMGRSLEARNAELAASRARVVAAADETRRRIERDLHDGAQQRLVHTVITLKLAREALEGADAHAVELVDEALAHAERATEELRELARGILPAILTRGGLRHGIEALATRLPVPVTVQVDIGRLPPAVEANAYFIVAEALTNVVKHAQAGSAQVTVSLDGDRLEVEVRDDGVGGARTGGGSGLIGLHDRAAAAGGGLHVESPPGGGTVVTARLPVPGYAAESRR